MVEGPMTEIAAAQHRALTMLDRHLDGVRPSPPGMTDKERWAVHYCQIVAGSIAERIRREGAI